MADVYYKALSYRAALMIADYELGHDKFLPSATWPTSTIQYGRKIWLRSVGKNRLTYTLYSTMLIPWLLPFLSGDIATFRDSSPQEADPDLRYRLRQTGSGFFKIKIKATATRFAGLLHQFEKSQ